MFVPEFHLPWQLRMEVRVGPGDIRDEALPVSIWSFYWCWNRESSWEEKGVNISRSKDAYADNFNPRPEMPTFCFWGWLLCFPQCCYCIPCSLPLVRLFPPPPHMSSSLSRPPYSWFLSVSLFSCSLFPFNKKENPLKNQSITFSESISHPFSHLSSEVCSACSPYLSLCFSPPLLHLSP